MNRTMVSAVVSDDGKPKDVMISVQSLPGDTQISGGKFSEDALREVLNDVESTCKVMLEKLKSIGPKELTLEFNVGVAVKSGKLMALLFEPEASAGLKVSMKWS